MTMSQVTWPCPSPHPPTPQKTPTGVEKTGMFVISGAGGIIKQCREWTLVEGLYLPSVNGKMSVYFFKCTFSIKVQKKKPAGASCGIFSGDSCDFTSPDEVGGLTLPRSTLRCKLNCHVYSLLLTASGWGQTFPPRPSDSLGQSCNVIQNGSSLFKPRDSDVFRLCRSSNPPPPPPSSSFIPVSDIYGQFPFHVPPRSLPPIRTPCSIAF